MTSNKLNNPEEVATFNIYLKCLLKYKNKVTNTLKYYAMLLQPMPINFNGKLGPFSHISFSMS